MASKKISQLTATTTPTGNEELVYAYNSSNGKMTLNTMKTFSNTGQQAQLVSGVNIKTINGESILGSGNIDIQGGGGQPTYDYSALQGPCSAGFHIPTNVELQTLITMGTTLGAWTDGQNFSKYLKAPYAGCCLVSGSIVSQGSAGYWWSCTASGTDQTYSINFHDSAASVWTGFYRASGASIRPFSDTIVAPDGTWTTIFDGSGTAPNAGIFYKPGDGLISISADGDTWLTIADKNLGATTVWNSGDAESYANCGNYYQRGNNYGFDWGTITTSSTQVDASTYGPGNYYSSSTFIKGSADWSSVQNDNLWGGVTGPQQQGGGGAGGYDCIVASDGTGDYTTIGAAISAGNYNIFVKNGSYTEAAGRDPYTNNSSLLHIVGESESGVQITMPSTMTTTNHYMIDMRYNSAADFYMENLSFNITLTTDNSTFYRDEGGSNFIVKNCSFVYDTTVASPSTNTHFLFQTSIMGSSSVDDEEMGRYKPCFYGCYFNTETTKRINICRYLTVARYCKFYSLAGRIYLSGDDTYLFDSYVDLYEIGAGEISMFNTYITVNHDVYDLSGTHDLDIAKSENSEFKLGTLANTPTIGLGVCTNSYFGFGSYAIYGIHNHHGISGMKLNCRIFCGDYKCGSTIGCKINATSLSFTSGERIIGNEFSSSLGNFTINNTGIIITDNIFKGTGAISITGQNHIFTNNIAANMTLSDTGTGNVKANNITAS